jgi:hypothetical protein
MMMGEPDDAAALGLPVDLLEADRRVGHERARAADGRQLAMGAHR